MKLIAFCISCIALSLNLFAQDLQIRNIYIDNQRVFEPEDKDWFFASEFLNYFHSTTRKYVIEDELLFKPNTISDEDYIYETERNLRLTELFTNVKVELDSLGYDNYDAYIITKDRWSLYPSIPFGVGGGEYIYGAKLDEFNLLGTGTYLKIEALHRSEHNIGWQGEIELRNRRLFRSPFLFDFVLTANKFKTTQNLSLYKPYINLDTRYSYGIIGLNGFGSNFIFKPDSSMDIVTYNEQNIKAFVSKSWFRNDRIFANFAVEVNNVERGREDLRLAFDNSGKILMMFSSVSQKYYPITNINYYHTEDMPIGGYGSATLGKIFPIANKDGDNLYYVGAQGEISYFKNNLYLFGQLTGASGFRHSQGQYTYQEFLGLGFLSFSKSLVLVARFNQQTAWNWTAYRQLLLDNERGLRGYDLNRLSGDNRIVSNLELRYFPDIPVWVINLSGVVFADLGAVWNQDEKIYNTQFYSSVGAGIRFHFTKSANPSQTIRIDFAYNAFDKKFGGIVISTKQLFSAFGNHDYKMPTVFGNTIDLE
ncbi:MAG TPA: hypothetical protein PLE30_10865 [Candidatus Kapabacteria bacterium]|nr:hypothetical protein [Candidatus Kapabacteria bacterium]